MRICKCGAVFIGSGHKCKACLAPRKMVIRSCVIVEAPGRCDEWIAGKCAGSECLNYCAHEDWIGWRKVVDKIEGQLPTQQGV